ncbi:hypothetical protein [Microbispora sp. NPDC046933]|uniref:hypothetical protein n=1 Tax=Microbispora sp. NPDC046933 TaxID=3155618 RepID=UPI0033D8D0E1
MPPETAAVTTAATRAGETAPGVSAHSAARPRAATTVIAANPSRAAPVPRRA